MTPGGPAEGAGPGARLGGRLDAVRAGLARCGGEALVVAHPPNVRYLSGHAGTSGILLVGAGWVDLLVDSRYREAVDRLVASRAVPDGLLVRDVPGSYDQAVVEALQDRGARAVAFEADHLAVGRFQWFERAVAAAIPGSRVFAAAGVVEESRSVKDPEEQAALRRSARALTPVAEAAFRSIRPGISEREVAGVIEAALRTAGFEKPAFDTIVASGPNGAMPHYRAGARILTPGDLVVLDFGGVMDGYCSDITRTVSVGPPSVEARRVYGAVRRAQQLAIDAVAPGVSASDVDGMARRALDAEGLGEVFGHGTGHGLGLEVHEAPRVGRPVAGVPAATLVEGMVVTIEPGAYLPGFGGVRIEDDVLVTATGHEVLTAVPRELLEL